ncbi:adenylate/guanylate cyclase domain-containing protein [Nocardia cerradoensis]|uniref:adenylate/guanylate cyclase domain-containing protein n=1 Tax=Nocardia cerradoensis TaxID=85688 RepID=UPI0005855332|nr:adenylate/guanylate cyclase domain-containing protein [Nocardia cerradoensis]NKY43744.1 adenylate/guanylate cyclase domain-containing protein [Nocardia cerradoensis]
MARSNNPLAAAPWGSRLLGHEDEAAGTRRLRVQLLLTVPIVLANLAGVFVSITLIGFVLPGPSVFAAKIVLVDAVAAPVYAVVAVLIGVWWGTVRGLRALGWAIDPDVVPTERQQAAAAAVPWRLVRIQAVLWFGGVVLLTLLAGLAEPGLIGKVAFGITFSAVVVCASTYLIIEFALRPVTSRVLAARKSRPRSGIGVFGRSLLMWLVGSGLPVAGLMVLAVLALCTDYVSTARLAVCVLSLGGATLLIGSLLMTQTLAATVAPINGVRRAMREVENGDLDLELAVYDGTELGELQSGFNNMVGGLREREEIRDLFGRHVGREVADAALAGKAVLGGVEVEAAALFIDIVGSTTMAASLPAPEMVAILNRFFGVVVDEVERHGGLLNKFEGDAALAVFGTPAPLPDAAGAALACGRAIRTRLDTDAADFVAAIGIAEGRVVAGNVGARQRYEFTVIGDAVNEAARLCELAKQDSLLLTSDKTVVAAATTEAEHWQLGESVTLRGRLTPTRLARPVQRSASAPTTE